MSRTFCCNSCVIVLEFGQFNHKNSGKIRKFCTKSTSHLVASHCSKKLQTAYRYDNYMCLQSVPPRDGSECPRASKSGVTTSSSFSKDNCTILNILLTLLIGAMFFPRPQNSLNDPVHNFCQVCINK